MEGLLVAAAGTVVALRRGGAPLLLWRSCVLGRLGVNLRRSCAILRRRRRVLFHAGLRLGRRGTRFEMLLGRWRRMGFRRSASEGRRARGLRLTRLDVEFRPARRSKLAWGFRRTRRRGIRGGTLFHHAAVGRMGRLLPGRCRRRRLSGD